MSDRDEDFNKHKRSSNQAHKSLCNLIRNPTTIIRKQSSLEQPSQSIPKPYRKSWSNPPNENDGQKPEDSGKCDSCSQDPRQLTTLIYRNRPS
ncbi:hypothetical protein AVEN_2272-1 [Araneus ventricosus]|uniref:Uncharacterized protein n=1 Tax=Araneus ventricosus TaxID=182803 RepID=A0A4Y2FRR1_ARAVE|nr:hypothetical protein AVEN_2272-1 [Araneus ventricosus]